MVSTGAGWTLSIIVGICALMAHGQVAQETAPAAVIPNQPNFVDAPAAPPLVIPNQPNFVDAPAAPPAAFPSQPSFFNAPAAPPALIPNPPSFAAAPAAPPAVVVDDGCLSCICQASTGCKPLACHVAGPSYFCGPYLISWAYWADAGKPSDDPTNPYAFEVCLNNKECSERTIRAYMNKNGRDCDGDNRITCHDIARIHKAGPLGCHNQWVDNTDYWKLFLSCNALG